MRAWEAHAPDSKRTSPAFLAYAQSTLAAGFVSVGKDLVAAVRCLLVRAVTTRPSDEAEDEAESNGPGASAKRTPEKSPAVSRNATFADEPPKMARISTVLWTIPTLQDRAVSGRSRRCSWWRWMTSKRERTLYDVACVCMSVAFVVVVALSLWSGAVYEKGMFYESWASRTVLLRCVLPPACAIDVQLKGASALTDT